MENVTVTVTYRSQVRRYVILLLSIINLFTCHDITLFSTKTNVYFYYKQLNVMCSIIFILLKLETFYHIAEKRREEQLILLIRVGFVVQHMSGMLYCRVGPKDSVCEVKIIYDGNKEVIHLSIYLSISTASPPYKHSGQFNLDTFK